MNGENGNGLRGAALTSAERRRAEDTEKDADRRALALALFALAGKHGGADWLRNEIGREDTLRYARFAGLDAGAISASWDEADRKVMRQASTKTGESWTEAPDYDERVNAALGLEPDGHGGWVLAGPSRPLAEISRIRRQVAAEYEQRSAARARAADEPRAPTGLPVTAAGSLADTYRALEGRAPVSAVPSQAPIGVSTVGGVPVQRSMVNSTVPPLGSEPVPPVPMSDVRQVIVTCTAHPGEPGEKFCRQCGRPRPSVEAAR